MDKRLIDLIGKPPGVKRKKADKEKTPKKQDTQPTQPTIPNQHNQPHQDTQPTQQTLPTQPTQAVKTKRRLSSLKPERDFTMVPNSIARAIPNRLFRGASKQTYDVFYQQTRGAITPARKIKITKSRLQGLTGFSINTLEKHIKYLDNIGLLRKTVNLGQHSGNEYEVFIPEEIDIELIPDQPNQPIPPNLPNPTQNVGGNPPNNQTPNQHQNIGLDGQGKPIDNIDSYAYSNTLFKTFKYIDDESATAFFKMMDHFTKAQIEITGKKPSKREVGDWAKLADLIILELRKAAKLTDQVSNVPAFLTEVLRRKFLIAPTGAFGKGKSSVKKDTVGKADKDGKFEIKNLTKSEREEQILLLWDFIDEREVLEEFAQFYTEKDWRLIMKVLEKEIVREK